MHVSLCRSTNTGVSMCGSPLKNVAYEFVLIPPACLVRLTWMVCEMGGKWLYCCCLVGCSLHDSFKTAPSNLVKFSTSPFSWCFLKVQVVSLFIWVLWNINICRLFNAKSIFIQINSSISKTFLFRDNQFTQTVLIQTIQFTISIDFVFTVKCQNSSTSNNSV